MTAGPIFKAGTVKRFLERNIGTARATYPDAAGAAIVAVLSCLSLETEAGMGDIHA
jgi:hypothetical protein